MADDQRALSEQAARLLQLDYFRVLGVARTASADEIAKAYVAAAKLYHPDRARSAEMRALLTKVFTRVDAARSTLADPARRAAYVMEITRPASASERNVAEAALEFKKAEAVFKKNDLAAAEKHARKAIELAPTNAEYGALLAWILAKPDAPQSRLAELARELDALVARAPTLERPVFYRGQIRKRLGRHDEAIADFARAVELNPGNIDAAREVRLDKMRRAEKPPPADSGKGVSGFLGRLLKR